MTSCYFKKRKEKVMKCQGQTAANFKCSFSYHKPLLSYCIITRNSDCFSALICIPSCWKKKKVSWLPQGRLAHYSFCYETRKQIVALFYLILECAHWATQIICCSAFGHEWSTSINLGNYKCVNFIKKMNLQITG